jgi:hypothetical protein
MTPEQDCGLSYPERDCYAYLTITSEVSLAEITAHMGRTGDGRCYSKGDPRVFAPDAQRFVATTQPIPLYRCSRWSLLSGLDQGRSLDDHLVALWQRIAGLRGQIWSLPDSMDARVAATARFASHRGALAISPGHFKTAAFCGLRFDFDFCFDDDFGGDDPDYLDWSQHQA